MLLITKQALEHVLVEQQDEMIAELKPKLAQITKDIHGNHVIQKVIEVAPKKIMSNIMNGNRGRFHQLAAHNYGCRVVQRMLEFCTPAEKKELMREIHDNADFLVGDQFGNYVAQHVIEWGDSGDRNRLIELVTRQLLQLSRHKFASNVVEKCIECGTLEQRKMRAQLTMPFREGTSSPLQLIIKDQYGNYVIRESFRITKSCHITLTHSQRT